jgi:hypothetical protein
MSDTVNPISEESGILWPSKVMTGVAGEFANTYVKYLESPVQFLFMAYLTVLGHMISDKVILDCGLLPQPRLFTVLVGESGATKKSTAITKTLTFFQQANGNGALNYVMGVGSAEGLAEGLFHPQNDSILRG